MDNINLDVVSQLLTVAKQVVDLVFGLIKDMGKYEG